MSVQLLRLLYWRTVRATVLKIFHHLVSFVPPDHLALALSVPLSFAFAMLPLPLAFAHLPLSQIHHTHIFHPTLLGRPPTRTLLDPRPRVSTRTHGLLRRRSRMIHPIRDRMSTMAAMSVLPMSTMSVPVNRRRRPPSHRHRWSTIRPGYNPSNRRQRANMTLSFSLPLPLLAFAFAISSARHHRPILMNAMRLHSPHMALWMPWLNRVGV